MTKEARRGGMQVIYTDELTSWWVPFRYGFLTGIVFSLTVAAVIWGAVA